MNELRNMRARIKIAGEVRVRAENRYFRNDLASILDRLGDATAAHSNLQISVMLTYRYAREYALERLGLLVLGLVALEDALDVRTEDTLVRVEGPQLLAEPGVEGIHRDRHRSRVLSRGLSPPDTFPRADGGRSKIEARRHLF